MESDLRAPATVSRATIFLVCRREVALESSEESGGNVVVRNSVQGWATKYSLTGDTAGPIESFSTPLTNPWANISY